MKIIFNLMFIAVVAFSYSGCEMLEKGSEDSSCGESFVLTGEIFPGTATTVDQAYYGFVDDNITFVFHTPNWLEQEPICPYNACRAEYNVTLNSDYMKDIQGLTMVGLVLVGQKTYEIPLQGSGSLFSGIDNSISLATNEYDQTGVAYIKGEVIIRFHYSGNVADDITKLKHALNHIYFNHTVSHVKI